MTKREHIAYWLKTAEHDFDAAGALFESAKYDWCLYVSHSVIEKILKAFWVRDSTLKVPRHDNLLEIARGTHLSLSEAQRQFLSDILPFNIDAASNDYTLELSKRCNKDFSSHQFEAIRRFYQWLLSQMEAEPVSKN